MTAVRCELPPQICFVLQLNRPFCALRVCSFRDAVRYELGWRGLVVVTGQVHDTAEAGEAAGAVLKRCLTAYA